MEGRNNDENISAYEYETKLLLMVSIALHERFFAASLIN